jgi:Zn-dependent protease
MDHTLAVGIGIFAGFMFSIIVHECAHALVAKWLGDDTAYSLGRVTLNPIPHIDPIFSILLPVSLWLSGSSVLFGGAKPVPVDIHRLRGRRLTSMMWVALAGPVSNQLLLNFFPMLLRSYPDFSIKFLQVLIGIVGTNVGLAVFNMLPIPPLDGSRVLAAALPGQMGWNVYRFEQIGMILIVILVFTGGTQLLLSAPVKFVFESILYWTSFGDWAEIVQIMFRRAIGA